jgi:hypothetical protein
MLWIVKRCVNDVLGVLILVERVHTQQDYVIQPLNLPPRYSDYAKGRVLVEFNTSADNTDTPWPTEPFPPPLDYWNSPGKQTTSVSATHSTAYDFSITRL